MISENKLKKLFNMLLGDKYKIVPIDEPEKDENKAEEAIVSSKELENLQSVLDLDDGAKDEKPGISEDEQFEMDFDDDFSDEAQELFERDKNKSDYFRNKEIEEKERPEEKIGSSDIIEEAQIVYDRITRDLANRIEILESSKKQLTLNI